MTEHQTISYECELNRKELIKLKAQYNLLEQSFINLQSKYSKIKAQYNSIISKEAYFKGLEFKFNEKDEQIMKLTQEIESIDTNHRKEIMAQELKYEKDVTQLKYQSENNNAKIDNATQIEKDVLFLLDQIQLLQSVIKNYENEERKRVKEREIVFEKEYSSMKNKMLEYIKVGKKKGRNEAANQGNLQYKLNLMNHNQLLSELEFQSVQIESLLKERENLDQIIREVKNDLHFHLELEQILLKKNKKLFEQFKSFVPQSLSLHSQNEKTKHKTISPQPKYKERHTQLSQSYSTNKFNTTLPLNRTMKAKLFNQSLSGFSTSVTNDTTKLTLQKELMQKQKEIENIKGKYNTVKDKLDSIQSRYKNILKLCDEVLGTISNNSNLCKSKEIFINMDNMKSGDFNSMSIEQKYSALTILINYILPIVSAEVLEEELNKQSIEKVERKFYLKKNNSVKAFSPFIYKNHSKIKYKTSMEFYRKLSGNNMKKENSLLKRYSIFKLNET